TMQEWRRLNKAGELEGPNALFFQPEKPKEELYDIAADPDEVNNLAADPQYGDVVKRMRKAVKTWMDDIHDLGFVPEPTLNEQFRPGGRTQKTAPLAASSEAIGGKMKITLSCPTPGASIGWRKPGDPTKAWRVYTGPIEMNAGETISAKACRIGFDDSPVLKLP
ncbi:MAG: chitobiase/beta-hexosaminidase C-terminal domain-containing protein, partial [bacterium]